jgi:hypothetical protein
MPPTPELMDRTNHSEVYSHTSSDITEKMKSKRHTMKPSMLIDIYIIKGCLDDQFLQVNEINQ